MVSRRPEELGCDGVQERLEALVDGELGFAERDAVETHCRVCAACGRERVRAEALRSALRVLPELEPPPDLYARVREAAAAETRVRWQRAWPPVIAAAAVLLAVGVVLMRPAVAPAPDPQLHRARAEARYALAVVGEACRRAVSLTRREAVLDRIVAPGARVVRGAFKGQLTSGGIGLSPSPGNGG